MRSCLLTVIALCALAAAPLSVRGGDLIVSSLNESNDGNDTITPYVPGVQPGFMAAQEFMTGSQNYLLTQILANLGNFDPGVNGEFTLTATLQADNGGKPGSVLTTFTVDLSMIPTASFGHVAFDPVSAVNLRSGVNYWFVLNGSSSDGTGGVGLSFTDGTSPDGPGSLPNFNNSNDNGATWNGPFPNQPYQIQVSGTLVPEPASWVLGSLGFAGMLLARRWSRSHRRASGSVQ
jgi:hypothetical protein